MGTVIKKAKGTKQMYNKTNTLFSDYKNCLLNNEINLKLQQSEAHSVYTEEINKIVLSSNGDKRLQTFDKIASYPYGTSVEKVCNAELLNTVLNIK